VIGSSQQQLAFLFLCSQMCFCSCVLQVVSVSFSELVLQYDPSCNLDAVLLFDAFDDISHLTFIGSFCVVAPSTITSHGSSLLIVFVTDGSVNQGRFSLNWTFSGQG